MGYGRSESRDGSVFQWNFPLLGTYWTAADLIIQHIGKLNGGLDKLKGKKIALVYHDSPYGKEPIPLLQKRAEMHGFEFTAMPVTHRSEARRVGTECGRTCRSRLPAYH